MERDPYSREFVAKTFVNLVFDPQRRGGRDLDWLAAFGSSRLGEVRPQLQTGHQYLYRGAWPNPLYGGVFLQGLPSPDELIGFRVSTPYGADFYVSFPTEISRQLLSSAKPSSYQGPFQELEIQIDNQTPLVVGQWDEAPADLAASVRGSGVAYLPKTRETLPLRAAMTTGVFRNQYTGVRSVDFDPIPDRIVTIVDFDSYPNANEKSQEFVRYLADNAAPEAALTVRLKHYGSTVYERTVPFGETGQEFYEFLEIFARDIQANAACYDPAR